MGQEDPLSLQTQARFAEGNIVDKKAQDILFSDGITVPFSRNDDAIDTTSTLMADAKIDRINQPTLRTPNGEVARLDSMERTAEGWNHEEVKSGLSVKDKHKFDALVSTDRALRAGVSIEDTWIVHLNRDWRLGDPDLDLFSTEDITGSMSDPGMVQFLADTTSKLMADSPPAAALVSGCWGCSHFSNCFGQTDNPITDLSKVKQERIAELSGHGVVDIADIPPGSKLTGVQRAHVDLVRNGQPIVNQDGLRVRLDEIQNPVRHLDFESASFAIPLHADVAPWGHVATQYSMHLESEGGLVHHEFLVEAEGDQRRALAERLIRDLGTEGSIVVWSVAYERGRIRDMAAWFPDLAPQLNAIEQRLYDLLPTVRANVQHPGFHNSYSLKSVAPGLVPGFGYDDLDIAGGGDAQGAMNLMMRGRIAAEEVPVLRERLLRYCERDTEATAAVLQALRDMIA
tara:strand:+ start:235 stop:1605 length:1371 start_codon:yes stop_codon:yes gene_type:complete